MPTTRSSTSNLGHATTTTTITTSSSSTMSTNPTSNPPSTPKAIVSISPPASTPPIISANYLPCSILYTGPTNATKHWHPCPRKPEIDAITSQNTKDGKEIIVSHFRGRKLLGRKIDIPEGYVGVVVSEPLVHASSSNGSKKWRRLGFEDDCDVYDGVDEVEEEKEVEDTRKKQILGFFDGIVVWGHEEVIEAHTDGLSRGVEEWIQFSTRIHDYDDDDE